MNRTISATSQRRTALLILLVLAGVALRIANVYLHSPADALYSDMLRHWQHALAPWGGDSPFAAIDPPGYQFWLALMLKLTASGHGALTAYAAFMSVVTVWVWYRFAREVLASKDAALLFAATITWSPSWIGIFSYFMNETLLLPLLGASLWMTWRALRKKALLSFALCTLLWTLAVTTRIVALPMAGIALAAAIYVQPAKWRAAAVSIGIALLVLAPAAYRSHQLLGIWAPLGYPAVNRIYWQSGARELRLHLKQLNKRPDSYVFISPSTMEWPLEPLSDWKTSRSGVIGVSVDLDAGTRDWEAALGKNHLSFPRWLVLVRENLVYALFGRSWPDLREDRFWERIQEHQTWMWAPLLLCVVAGNIAVFRMRRMLSLFPLIVLISWVALFLEPTAVMEGRFRKPLEGITFLNAMWLIESARGMNRKGDGYLQEATT